MIAYIKGQVVEASENYMVVETDGIAYELTATMGAIFEFKGKSERVTVPTYLQVREDGVTLFGFKNVGEKSMFLKLITVSGVGPKLAVTILSGITVEDLCLAIATEDLNVLSKIKGLGKKTAEKIIVELREKVGSIAGAKLPLEMGSIAGIDQSAIEDATMALSTLGMSTGEAMKLATKHAKEGDSAEDIIKKCLKDMAR